MRKLTFINLIIASILILASCSTSNNVVSNKLISKRKYTKGFHINKKANYKATKEAVAEREEIESPNYAVTSSDNENEIKETVADVSVNQAKPKVVQEALVTNEIDEKSTYETFTEENQSQNQDFGSKLTRALSQKEITNRIKKAASSSNSDLMDLLLLILIVILIFILIGAIGGDLGYILGLILLIVLVWLLLRYLGVI